MDEDPSNEAFVLSLLEGYGVDEAEAMEIVPPPAQRIGGPNTSLGLIKGNFPRSVKSQTHRQDGQIVHYNRR
jgi:hypothetical protein